MVRLLTGTEVAVPSAGLERLEVVGRSTSAVLGARALLFRTWRGLVEFSQLLAVAMEVAREVEAAPAARWRSLARAWWRARTMG